jgi:hypothetical protein
MREVTDVLRLAEQGQPGSITALAEVGRRYGVDVGMVRNLYVGMDGAGSDEERIRASLAGGVFQAQVTGRTDGGYDRLAAGMDRMDLGFLLTDAMEAGLADWAEGSPSRLAATEQLVLESAPEDPSIAENALVNETVDSFTDWQSFEHDVIVVPGYTPRDSEAKPGVHPTAKNRLEKAVDDFRSGKAPFIMVSGGNVHPKGTQYHEAVEMKKALLEMGVPEDRIIVDARARHSTTNLRNAGRYMQEHGMHRALVTTTFGQDFYYSFAGISTFHRRSMNELGYRVGSLSGGVFDPWHTEFAPSAEVGRVNIRDPLDP